MEITLEMIDSVVARTNATFQQAKEALEKTNGNVVDAIIYIESAQKSSWQEELTDKGNEIIKKVKEILKKGNVTRITVKKDDEVILNLPITAAAVGAIISAPLALIGLGGALLSKCTVEIQKEDGEVIKVNEMVPMDKRDN
ncbi:MAG TPA: DUF4342 domain-containing protein [Tissierellia bacterium]|nr:DUF4342 domain-containing protein [Tissierellia bacterium]